MFGFFKPTAAHTHPVYSAFLLLATGRSSTIIAMALLAIFFPIFLYQWFDANLQHLLLYYTVTDIFYVALLPWGARTTSWFGFSRILTVSMVFGALYYGMFLLVDIVPFLWLLVLSLIVRVLIKLAFWLPYHMDFALFTKKGERGRKVSLMMSFRLLVSIIAPIIAASIIVGYGYDSIFLLAVVLHLVAIVPFIMLPEVAETFTWSYKKTWSVFFDELPKSRSLWSMFAIGAEEMIALIIWPIFIFELLDGNYLEVGGISTLIVLVAAILQYSTGKLLDTKYTPPTVIRWGSPLYALGWVIKLFATTAFDIFVAGVYHRITRIFSHTSYYTLDCDQAADQGHYIDEYTVISEIAINLGRTIMGLLAFVLLYFMPVVGLFVFAAVLSLFLSLMRHKDLRIDKLDDFTRGPSMHV